MQQSELTSALTFFPKVAAGALVLTPNRRLSATLHKHYQKYQLQLDQTAWPTPNILPALTWIQKLFYDFISQKCMQAPMLLTHMQEQFLWEQILLNSDKQSELLQLSETAELTRTAWNLLKQWRLNLEDYCFQAGEDSASLLQWIKEFKSVCKSNHWMDQATLPDLLTDIIIKNDIQLPNEIILFGFTELSPQLKYLLDQCRQKNCRVQYESFQVNSETFRIALHDEQEELFTIARFAKTILAKNPKAEIGCVIPNLDKIRDRVQQIFSQVFADANSYTIDTKSSPFNISAGKSLVQYPLIHTAFQLLSLHKKTVGMEIFTYLLTSPFIGGAESERIKRAHVDSHLRRGNITHIDLTTLLQTSDNLLQFPLARQCPDLTRRIKAFLAVLSETSEKHSYYEWAQLINKLLSALGWPGERVLNSEEYQVVETWLGLLIEFSTLDQIAAPVTMQNALHILHKMARKLIFQPKSPDASIQILGMLEAASLPFDYLWISGMDDLSWPPQPKPNPLIPKSLQRKFNMPHATAERELMFCETLTQQFKTSAQQVFFSHTHKKDELELQASPLIRNLPSIDINQLQLDDYLTPSERIYLQKEIEILVDEKAPVLQSGDKVSGGINVIKLQALCPFRAFAECRLYARELESPLPGLRAKDRGNIMHKSLELIWSELNNHATLISHDEKSLQDIVNRNVEKALLLIQHSRGQYKQYMKLEKQRLGKIILEWLQLEKDREPFKVRFNESKEQIKLNQLQLNIRIDRIDELADGKKFVIDYKTGKNNEINHWFSERPEEPQLPLYAMLDRDNIVGIAFAQIAPGESCFKGVSHYALPVKGIKLVNEIKKSSALSWAEQLDQWSTILGKLSDDFYYGDARVDPKDPAQTCTWCAMKPICRINERDINHDK